MSKFFFKFSQCIFIIFLISCSFDKKSGIWTDKSKEKNQESSANYKGKIIRYKSITSRSFFEKEVFVKNSNKLSIPKKSSSWPMSSLNLQNSVDNISYLGNLNILFKKKVGKNKYEYSKNLSAPITFNDSIILADNFGTIFSLNETGKVNWKKNIYKKINKEIHKNISYVYYNRKLYFSDNIGYLYSLDPNNGKLIWIKNYGIPFKSQMKISNDNIYLIDQDNKVICFNVKEGSRVWILDDKPSFIKSQKYLGLSLLENKYAYFISSSGIVSKVNSANGNILWSFPSIDGFLNYDTDFFSTSNIVVGDKEIIFSNLTSNTFSLDLNYGYPNWINEVKSSINPIISGDNVFILTDNGYLTNIDRNSGKLLWSNDILKLIKRKKFKIKMSGFILGNNKIYSTTTNGYLIISSSSNGKVEKIHKVAKSIYISPIISNEKMFILTGNSKIIALD